MKWKVKLGEDYDYEDYDRLLKNHELDEIMPTARDAVAQFIEQYPTVPINEVILVIHKDATVDMHTLAAEATPADDCKIVIASKEADHETII